MFPGVVAVRDSKTSPDTSILRLSPASWRVFTAAQ
ncbi:DUF397 domain-containing protein [Streptomyces sp. NBC_00576]